ncbi:MAG: tetratricopeptide repeat protein [Blastocatellia bacterium]
MDTGERLLLRDGKPVPLTLKAYDLLVMLVQHPGHLLGRDELTQSLWPDRFVEDANLTVNVATLRKALGEGTAGQHYIETVPKRGYRFLACVEEVTPEAREPVPASTSASSGAPTQEQENGIGREDQAITASAADSAPQTIARSRRRPRLLAFGLLAFGLIAAGMIAIIHYFRMAAPPKREEIKSIAVLPFKLLTPNHNDEYFGLGMADALITSIGNLQQVVVRPTSAVRNYAAAEQDPVAAGRALKVDSVLEGSIQRNGERIRVTARLVSAQDGRSLWSGKFDEEFKDVFTLQDSICRQVVSALALQLTIAERELLAKHSTRDPEAYQLYLKGRYFWNLRSQQNLKKAAGYFQQAIEKDPTNALAYASLAECYTLLSPVQEFIPKTRAAATRALEMDSSLAEAHTALAHPSIFYEWDWPAGERELKKAIEINPNYPTARHWYALYLTAMGRLPEALKEIKRARDLDPLSLVINTHLGNILYYSRQYDLAIEQYQKTLEMNPNFALTHFYLGYTYLENAKYEESVAEFQKASSLGEDVLENLGYSYGRWGKRDEARRILQELKKRSKRESGSPSEQALVYLGLGDKEQALQCLQKACVEEKPYWFIYLNVDPKFDGLRSTPGFRELLRCVGLMPSEQVSRR